MNMPFQNIKLIAIDIDGTLLTPQKQITPRTLAAIQAAREAGIIVTLATARRYHNTAPIADELGITIPLVLCDGALTIEHPQGIVLNTHMLEAEVAQQAVDIMVRHKIQPVVHHLNGTVEETWTGFLEYDTEWVTRYFTAFPNREVRRLHYAECCTGQPDPLRVVAFASEEAINELIPEISALSCEWHTTQRGSYGCAEMVVMRQECSKASGVRALARLLEIPLNRVMAIGDNNNDLAMLQAVGWGVAMGQASETIKAAAHAVTASNEEDGVAQAIERYALCLSEQSFSNSFKRAI